MARERKRERAGEKYWVEGKRERKRERAGEKYWGEGKRERRRERAGEKYWGEGKRERKRERAGEKYWGEGKRERKRARAREGGGGGGGHTNDWAPRTRKRHQQEHRPQRPTQHAKGSTGDCPGPRKGTTTHEMPHGGGREKGIGEREEWGEGVKEGKGEAEVRGVGVGVGVAAMHVMRCRNRPPGDS